ncbi:VapA/VapB family virulence-associated protein [Flavobacterium praedii]|uniref:VapA/VapB family virulence-associated protein n=1 Tax=Flavobacterium praedii TaxID=3002900 RepID=UPI002482056D|nr:VapA/VapB family virulence-associated protein [Flavobacterium praedii]
MSNNQNGTNNLVQGVSKEIIAHDFHVAMDGKLDNELIYAAKDQIFTTTASYPAKGSSVSMIFYLQFQVSIDNGKTFNGKAGGISTPGGGALFGDIYTDDINRLYSNTVSFQFTSTPVYLSLIFFDNHSNVLGTFQCGSVSTVTGIGGGTGSWS